MACRNISALGISRNGLVRSRIRDRRLTQLRGDTNRGKGRNARILLYSPPCRNGNARIAVFFLFNTTFLHETLRFWNITTLVVAPVLLSCPSRGLAEHVLPARLRKSRSVWIRMTLFFASKPPFSVVANESPIGECSAMRPALTLAKDALNLG